MMEEQAEALVTGLSGDHRHVSLTPRDRAMIDFAAKLTQVPAAVGAVEIAQLRGAGYDDRAIHDICAITAYYAFVNRIADGLGVELEARYAHPGGVNPHPPPPPSKPSA